MPIDSAETNRETQELMMALTKTGMEAQVLCSQMIIVLRGSPEAGKRLVNGTLEPDELIDKTMEMYDVDEHPLSYHIRCEVAKETIQMAQKNLEGKA
jgi:hypothetical protein